MDVQQTTQTSYPGSRSLAVDSTGDRVLFGGANGAAGVWSISQNSLVETLDGGNGTVTDGVWAGTRAVLALSTGAVKVFEDGAEVASFNQHAGSVRAVALHPCGDIIASVGADKSYILYDLQSLKPITQVPTDSRRSHPSPSSFCLLLLTLAPLMNLAFQNLRPPPSIPMATSSLLAPARA